MAIKIGGVTVVDDSKNATLNQITFPDNSIQSTSATKVFKGVLYVSNSGNDTTGNGTVSNPFASIQKAHDYAQTTYTNGEDICITVAAGSYGGNITLSRPKTHVIGMSNGTIKNTRIAGTVTINPTSSSGVYSDTFTLEKLLIAATVTSGGIINLASSHAYSFFGNDIFVFGEGIGGSCIDSTNTSSGIRLELNNSTLQNYYTTQPLLNLVNALNAPINNVTFNSYGAPSMRITTSRTSMYNSKCYATTATPVIDVVSAYGTAFNPVTAPTGNIALTLGNCVVVSTATNGSGINVAAGATLVAGVVSFSVPAGTGFAVNGSSGALLIAGDLYFFPGANASIASAFVLGTSYLPLVDSTKIIGGALINYGPVIFDNKLANAGVPTTSKGLAGNLKGQVAFDGTYFYYCTANFTGNNANIWKRVAWSADTW